jgi:hypothetical protein
MPSTSGNCRGDRSWDRRVRRPDVRRHCSVANAIAGCTPGDRTNAIARRRRHGSGCCRTNHLGDGLHVALGYWRSLTRRLRQSGSPLGAAHKHERERVANALWSPWEPAVVKARVGCMCREKSPRR